MFNDIYLAKKIKLSIFTTIILLIALSPLIKSSFFDDDILNSQISSMLVLKSMGFWNFVHTISQGWMKSQARLMFGAFAILYGMWNILGDNVVLVKSFQLVAILFNIFLFQKVIARISGCQFFGAVFGLLIVGFFQMRIFADPILSFTFFLQLQFFLIIAAIALFWNYLNTHRYTPLFAGAFIYVFYLLTYELALIIPIIFFGVNWLYKKTIDKKMGIIYSFITIIYFTVIIYLRKHTAISYEGIQFGSFNKFLQTYLIQTSAALPLSYSAILGKNSFLFDKGEFFVASLLVLFMFLGLKSASKSFFAEKIQHRSIILYINLVMIFFPPLLIAISAKYQQALLKEGFGLAYLPVYIQSFGLCGLTTIIWNSLGNYGYAKNRLVFYFSILVFSLIVGFTYVVNEGVVKIRNSAVQNTLRELIGASLKSGLLANVPDGSIILRDQDNKIWERNSEDNSEVKTDNVFYFGHAKKRVKIFSIVDFVEQEKIHNKHGRLDLNGKQVYFLKIKRDIYESKSEYVAIARVKSIQYKQNKNGIELEDIVTDPKLQMN